MMIKWGSNMFILISNGVDFVELDYNRYLLKFALHSII